MIRILNTKTCANYEKKVQVEALFDKALMSFTEWEKAAKHLHFTVLSLGNPQTLICRRKDCLLIVYPDGRLSFSESASERIILEIIDNLQQWREQHG